MIARLVGTLLETGGTHQTEVISEVTSGCNHDTLLLPWGL